MKIPQSPHSGACSGYTVGEFSIDNAPKQHVFWIVGGNRSTRRKPAQTRGECANSAQWPELGIKPGSLALWGSSANHCATVPLHVQRSWKGKLVWKLPRVIFIGYQRNNSQGGDHNAQTISSGTKVQGLRSGKVQSKHDLFMTKKTLNNMCVWNFSDIK